MVVCNVHFKKPATTSGFAYIFLKYLVLLILLVYHLLGRTLMTATFCLYF